MDFYNITFNIQLKLLLIRRSMKRIPKINYFQKFFSWCLNVYNSNTFKYLLYLFSKALIIKYLLFWQFIENHEIIHLRINNATWYYHYAYIFKTYLKIWLNIFNFNIETKRLRIKLIIKLNIYSCLTCNICIVKNVIVSSYKTI